MEFTVVSYGAGDVLHTTFNAIASLINANTGTLYRALVRLGLIIGLFWATLLMIQGDVARFAHSWIVPMYVALTLFFAPTCRVHIHDTITHERFTVANVPWGLGLVSGTLSQMGDTLTQQIEKTFSLPDDLKYHKTGAVMASNLIAQSRTFQVTNADLTETLRSFMNQCVVYDALLGKKYTLDDLRNTPDIWKLASENPSPARCFTFRETGRGKIPEILTCQAGVARLKKLLDEDVQKGMRKWSDTLFGKRGSLSNIPLKQYLPSAFNYMTDMAKSAEELMMQQMMIYGTVDAIETKSTALGNAPNFAVRRAYLQGRANQETLAGVAANKIVAMKNVLEALLYASFIFLLPLAMLPTGWSFIRKWVMGVLWIQLWPPLYAVLNFIMNLAVRAKGIGAVTTASGITIANSVGFTNLHADMAAEAGYMTIAVGTLAYALLKGGVEGLSSLVSHMSGPATSAAASASDSMLSGNYSFGNVTTGAVQASNTTFGQHNVAPSYTSGAFAQNDGNIARTTTPQGEHILNISTSNLRSNVQLSETMSENYTEQATRATQAAENQMVAVTKSQAESLRNLLDLSHHQAKQISSGETHSHGITASQNKSFQKLDNLVDRFAKDHSLSKEDAVQLLSKMSANASIGWGLKLFGTGATTTFSAEVGSQGWDTTSDRETLSAAKDYVHQSSFQDALNEASQAAHDLRYSELSDTGKRYVEGMNAASEKSHQYRDEASANLQKSEAFSQMASMTRQNAGSINANLNQEYVNWLQQQELPHSKGPMGITEAQNILSNQPDLDRAYQKHFLEGKMQATEHHFSSYSLPKSEREIENTFQTFKSRITPEEEKVAFKAVESQAMQSGVGEGFKVDSKIKDKSAEQLSLIHDRLDAQEERLEREARMRKSETAK